jgi:hypothetical protein
MFSSLNLNSAIFNNQLRANNSQFPKCAPIRVRLEDRSWLRVITILIYILNFHIAIQHSYCFAWLLITAEFRLEEIYSQNLDFLTLQTQL